MIETLSSGSAADPKLGAMGAAAGELDVASILPRQAKTVRDTGLEPRLVTGLVLKAIHAIGKTPLPVLSGKLKLSVNVLREVLTQLMAEQQVEVAWCGDSDIDVQYQLTAIGQRSAAEHLAQCRYAGPAPVPLAAYRAMVERQSLRRAGSARVSPKELAAALADDGLEPPLRDMIGAALHSRRSLLLYGPSGSGKTTLAKKLGQLLHGPVALPYALLVEGQIVQFHDPQLHPAPQPLAARQQEERRSCDTRWAICQRPLVHVGASLTRDLLDLHYDAVNGVYRAPPHFQANNGLLIIDDLGAQRLPAAEVLHRWAGPLEQGFDQLSMQGGQTESVPLDATVVFVTSQPPETVFGAAHLARIGYKVALGPMAERSYRALLRRQCHARDIEYDEQAADHLLALHRHGRCPLLAAYPHELLGRIQDFASFADVEPRFAVAALEQAWHSMFSSCSNTAPAPLGPDAILSGD